MNITWHFLNFSDKFNPADQYHIKATTFIDSGLATSYKPYEKATKFDA